MSSQAVVYLDIVFLGNTAVNYLLLWATAKISSVNLSKLRILTGALIGALYSLSLFLPSYSFLINAVVKILISFLMLVIAFYPFKFKKFLSLTAFFYLISFSLGGAVFALVYFISDNMLNNYNGLIISFYNFWPALLLASFGLLLSFTIIPTLWKKRSFQHNIIFPVCIGVNGQNVEIKAIVDTGNQLVEPISGDPVVIVEKKVFLKILPSNISQLFYQENKLDCFQILAEINDDKWLKKFKIIPFSSLGKGEGILLAFRPDLFTVYSEEKAKNIKQILVGFHEKNLSSDNNYQALLHPDIFNYI